MQVHEKLKQLEAIEQRLSAKKSILVNQALHSTNPSDLIKANSVMNKITPYEEVDRKSYIVDPYQFNSFMGYKDKPYSLSYRMLRRMSYGVPIIRAIIGTRIDQVADYCEVQKDKYSIGFVIRKKQPHYNTGEQPKITKEEAQKIDEITDFILNCGVDSNSFENDDFDTFVRKIINDSLIYDQMCFEVTRNPFNKKVTSFLAVDASTMRIADTYDQQHFEDQGNRDVERIQWGGNTNMSSKKQFGYYPKFCQIKDQVAVADYYPWELSFGVRNPTTDIYNNGYGVSEQEILVNTITSMLWSDEYNRRFFSQGSAPKGLLKIKQGSGMNSTALAQFKQQWTAMMSGVYNCLDGETKIFTSDGCFKINDFLGELQEKEVKIWTGQNFETGLVYKTPEKKQLIESVFEGNRRIKTSPDHKFLTVDDKGDLVWKEQNKLKIGDSVAVGRKAYTSQVFYLYFNGMTVGSDLIEILGWLQGDGHIGKNIPKSRNMCLFFHPVKELNILEEYFQVLKKYGINCQHTIVKKTEKQVEDIKKRYGFKSVSDTEHRIDIFDINFYEFVIDYCGFHTSSEGKIVPNSIFKLRSGQRAAFLRGLFSADGCPGRYSAALTVAHDSLRIGVCDLLTSLGIRYNAYMGVGKIEVTAFNKTYTRKNNGSEVSIKDGDLFYEKIGFKQIYKKQQERRKDTEGPKTEKIPAGIWRKYLTYARENQRDLFTKTQLIGLATYMRLGGTKPSFVKYLTIAGVTIPKIVEDHYFEKLVDVIDHKVKIDMYDVQVNNKIHAFVANGLIVHNSWKTPILEGDIDWVDLQKSNNDMEFAKWQEYLIKVSTAIYRIDPSEINFPLSGGSGDRMFGTDGGTKERIQNSKDKGLYPLLKFLQRKINKYIVSQIDPRFEFSFQGLDVDDPKEELEADIKMMSNFMTIDEIRVRRGLMPLGAENGGNVIANSIWLQNKNAQAMAEQQQQQGGQGGDEEQGQENPDDSVEDEQDDDESDPFTKAFDNYIKTLQD